MIVETTESALGGVCRARLLESPEGRVFGCVEATTKEDAERECKELARELGHEVHE